MNTHGTQDIAARIPKELQDADETLTRYGRWAMHRHHKQRCASAEGQYRVPPNDDDRLPRELLLGTQDALRCQRALATVPSPMRLVLAVLYVPQRIPAVVQLRILRIPPRLSQERHLAGLWMFRAAYTRSAIDSARSQCQDARHLIPHQ